VRSRNRLSHKIHLETIRTRLSHLTKYNNNKNSIMTNFAIHTLFLLLGSATVASARSLSLLRMAPVHAENHSITPHSELGHSLRRQDSAA
jgi:hypothetical protein